ncbi:hypothetical protein C5S29_13745, partial [ANME-1 cluster archaeon GoMg3.2]|nr:hypothetical protein [ANME-1 cluster archaeon GoMg3.2]
ALVNKESERRLREAWSELEGDWMLIKRRINLINQYPSRTNNF